MAERLLYLQEKTETFAAVDALQEVADWEAEADIRLAQKQRQAIESVLEHGILVLTGGPGTGKTTVVRGMIGVLEKQGMLIALGAPTGRAKTSQ